MLSASSVPDHPSSCDGPLDAATAPSPSGPAPVDDGVDAGVSEGKSRAATGSTQYFDSQPTVPSKPQRIELHLPDWSIELDTDRGVFSPDRVDPGSKLLVLEGPPAVPTDRRIADIGAGYGPIALVLAHRNPDATIYAIEVNERARALCAANAARLGLRNVVVAEPGDIPHDLVFDRIWSNPPIRIGKAALHELLRRWLGQLAPTGSAHLVVQKHLGADSLARWLQTEGFTVTRRASRKAYRLLDINPKPKPLVDP